MQFNNFFFPIPKPQYSEKDLFEKLIFIEHKNRKVPCCFEKRDSNIYLIYFHGNSQDLSGALQFMQMIKKTTELNCNILVVEYPGYGIYKNFEPSEQLINEDAEAVYQYVEKQNKDSEIYIIGRLIIWQYRSMGSGPACYLGTMNKAKGVILISAYASFKKIAYHYVKFLNIFVKDQFKNANRAKQIEIPILLIHGKQDEIIPYQHSEKIHDKYLQVCNQRCKSIDKRLCLRDQMSHNQYDMIEDICRPIVEFIEHCSGQMISQQQF